MTTPRRGAPGRRARAARLALVLWATLACGGGEPPAGGAGGAGTGGGGAGAAGGGGGGAGGASATTITILKPAGGDVAAGQLTIRGEAKGDPVLLGVEVSIGEGPKIAAEGGEQFSATLPLASLPDGPHVARAVAKGATGSTAAAEVPFVVRNAMLVEADWLLGALLPDGAICHYPDCVKIVPYWSNLAALGLVRAHEASLDPAYAEAALAWLEWYGAHQDAQGYVTDHDVAGGVATSTGTFDSTDSYAATFLLAVRAARRAGLDPQRLALLAPAVERAVSAIESTQQPDGLTWAKPDYPIALLMDLAETYAGLRAAEELASAFGDPVLAARAADDAARMHEGVEQLWAPAAGLYAASHDANGNGPAVACPYYPNGAAQAWAVAFGNALVDAGPPLVPEERAAPLLQSFLSSFPAWSDPTSGAPACGEPGPLGYWPPVGLALLWTGEGPSAAAGAAQLVAAAEATARAWPYTTGHAGEMVLLLGALPE